MDKPTIKWINLGTFATLVFTIVGNVISNMIDGQVLSTALLNAVRSIGSLLWSVITFRIQLWIVILFIGLVLTGKYLWDWLRKTPEPYASYTKGKLRVWVWEWEWQKSAGKWIPYNLVPHCPACNTPLGHERHYPVSGMKIRQCPRCQRKYEGGSLEFEHDTVSLIQDNVRRSDLRK